MAILARIPFYIALIISAYPIIKYKLFPEKNSFFTIYQSVSDKTYFTFILLIIVFVLTLFPKMKIWVYLYTLILVLCIPQLLTLSDSSFFLIIGTVYINLLPWCLLIIHVLVHGEYFGLKLISKKTENQVTSTNNIEENLPLELDETKTKGFEKRFDKKSTEELEEIIREKYLVPEAIEAATRILSQR